MYDEECEGCKISQGDPRAISGIRGQMIIELKGGWTLNHFSDPNETYLGRLVLQPKCHRMDFDDLSREEVENLGENLQHITKVIKDYWKESFKPDEIQRVYIVYFWETPYAKKRPQKNYHMHIHILPRSKNMVRGHDPIEAAAWHMQRIADNEWFPSEYRIVNKDCGQIRTNEINVERLMNYLRRCLCKE